MRNKKLLKILIFIILIIIIIPPMSKIVESLSEKKFIKKIEMSIQAYANYNTSASELSRIDITDKKIALKNNKFKSGTLMSINNGEIEVYYITDGKYCASGKLGDLKVTKGPCQNDKIDDLVMKTFVLNTNPNGGIWNQSKASQNIKLLNEEELFISNPYRDNFVFEGWLVKIIGNMNDNKDGFLTTSLKALWNDSEEEKNDSKTNISNLEEIFNKDLLGDYVINEFDLNINPNGGEYNNTKNIVNLSLKTDSEIKLMNPYKVGYKFIGWNAKIIGIVDSSKKINLSIDLTAKYEANINTLTIDLNDEKSSVNKVSLKTDETYKLQIPSREGYRFIGWQLDNEMSKINESNTVFTMGGKDTKITAKWEKLYSLTIDLNGGTGSQLLEHKIINGEKLLLDTPTKTNYIFYDWHLTGTNSKIENNIFIMGTEDAVVSAKWANPSYKYTIDLNGGMSNQILENEVAPRDMFILTVPTKKGYKFVGWTVEGENSKVQGNTFTMGTANSKITAKWEPIKYEIVYDLDGGIANNITSYTIETKTFTLNNPIKQHYIFAGWISASDVISQTITINKGSIGKKVYKAKWIPVEYNIKYNLNGGKADNVTSYNIETKAFQLNNPVKEGYTFIGWTSDSNNTPMMDISINNGNIGNMEFNANYLPIKYEIILESNNGNLDEINYTIEDEITLPVLTREDYIFEGWYEKEDFSGNNIIKIEKGTLGNKKFYAKWGRDYLINLDLNVGLPEGYTLLKYIESTGTQYIDTGFSAPEGFFGNAIISFTELYGEETILGSHGLSYPYERNYIGTTNGGKVWEIGVGNMYESSTASLSTGNIYNIEFSTFKGDSYLKLADEKIISSTESNGRSANNVLLYTCQWVLHSGAKTAFMRIYKLELYDSNDELRRDFIPAINPDGVIGLYDKIEGVFYQNAGTDTFKYEEMSSKEELTKIVSLRSTYGALPTPEREGYNFKGWYTQKTEGLEITSDTIVTEDTEGQTLYARWEKIENKD